MRTTVTVGILLLFIVLAGCAELQEDVKVMEDVRLSTKELVKQRHVDMYLRKEASLECNRVGRKLSVGRGAANVVNSHSFIVQNEENSIKAILVCQHKYTERINIWSYVNYETETKPVYYIMSKKHDDNNRLMALKLLEKTVLIK